MNIQSEVKAIGVKDFNQRYGGTIGYSLKNKKFYLLADTGNVYYSLYRLNDRPEFELTHDFMLSTHSITDEGSDIQVGPLPSRFINSVNDKQTYLIIRIPKRYPKQGSVPGANILVRSTFLESLPKNIIRELVPIMFYKGQVNANPRYFLHLVNNHISFDFESAVEQVASKSMLSCSFHPQWQLSYTANEPGVFLFYRESMVGKVDCKARVINIINPALNQEVKDIIKYGMLKWDVK